MKAFHVSPDLFDRFRTDIRFPYVFFSSKPIKLSGTRYLYTCELTIRKPFIFGQSFSWGYPLWRYLADSKGFLIPETEFTKDKYDGYMGCSHSGNASITTTRSIARTKYPNWS